MFSRLRSIASPGNSTWSAICLYADRIDVARVSRAGDRPLVQSMESYERGGHDIEALKRIGKKYGLRKVQCTTLLAPADYQMLQVEQPGGAADQAALREGVRERVADSIDQPIANVGYDVVAIPTQQFAPGRTQNAFAVVAGNAAIAPKVRLFHDAGVALSVIDIPEMAQRNVAALCEQPDRALAFLVFERRVGLLTFTCNGELYMSRRIDVGLDDMLVDDLDRRSTVYDRIGLEVQRSLDNFDRQYGFLPLARVLLGPQPEAAPLKGFLQEYLGLKVDSLDLADILDFPSVPELKKPLRQSQCLQSIGAALRSETAGAPG